jgi:hypothetical protein
VCPTQAFGEFPQEAGRGDRAAFAAGDVRHVGEVALQELGIFLGYRQAPGAVVGALAGRCERLGQRVVGREESAVMRAERDDAGARQRRNVDDGLRLEAARVRDRVA